MCSIWRTLDRKLLRDALAVAAATGVIGISFGAIAVASGMPAWLAAAMSTLVFAGGSQFMALGVLAAGGGAVAAVLAALLLNVRHLPFGLAIADVLGPGRVDRFLGCHLMTDETVAFALTQTDPRRRRVAYWTSATALFVTWNTGVLVGAFAGQALGDPNAFGVDAAFPASIIALLLPALRDRATARVALAAATVALATTPVLPAGLPVLLALLGLLAAYTTAKPQVSEEKIG
ncbi:branched-chain amino acid ABC transporter permease [Longimycelium tulufanense]|uniref:Branched-chain amino acid ABC transporter permease n=1 Tax=Longimycelium tulufanense TaxID=907463 RepID=A0A8J3FVX0_9PSEU|nr:AzlC family ABC transporter permease [Longimycelium tulufanense]GGM72208.1 branched-chain amino acid ABC transporter permease [Longimycelium tulufanense]